MANRVVKQTDLAHYNEVESSYYPPPSLLPSIEADKSKSISELSREELQMILNRLHCEIEAENLIRDLRRSAGEKDTYENPAKIDTKTPVDQMYHHGIFGMHWGIRRFQKEDGHRTPAGKKREAAGETVKSEDYLKSRADKGKSPAGLSNDELRKLNERLLLETTYKKLNAEQMQKSESFVAKTLKAAGGAALASFATAVFLGAAKTLVKELSPTFAETAFSIKPTPTPTPTRR